MVASQPDCTGSSAGRRRPASCCLSFCASGIRGIVRLMSSPFIYVHRFHMLFLKTSSISAKSSMVVSIRVIINKIRWRSIPIGNGHRYPYINTTGTALTKPQPSRRRSSGASPSGSGPRPLTGIGGSAGRAAGLAANRNASISTTMTMVSNIVPDMSVNGLVFGRAKFNPGWVGKSHATQLRRQLSETKNKHALTQNLRHFQPSR
jgi:hypothetical protein